MSADERAGRIAEALSSPRGRRKLAWDMTRPIRRPVMGGLVAEGPWDGYPDSPPGTMEVWADVDDVSGRVP